MSAIVKGRVCIKTKGRDAGREVVIAEVKDYPYVTAVTSDGKRSRCNARHLLFTEKKGSIHDSAKPETANKEAKKR